MGTVWFPSANKADAIDRNGCWLWCEQKNFYHPRHPWFPAVDGIDPLVWVLEVQLLMVVLGIFKAVFLSASVGRSVGKLQQLSRRAERSRYGCFFLITPYRGLLLSAVQGYLDVILAFDGRNWFLTFFFCFDFAAFYGFEPLSLFWKMIFLTCVFENVLVFGWHQVFGAKVQRLIAGASLLSVFWASYSDSRTETLKPLVAVRGMKLCLKIWLSDG